MIKVGLMGAKGRMGKVIAHLLDSEYSAHTKLAVTADKGDDFKAILEAEVVIDFSSPSGLVELAKAALGLDKSLPSFVVGSTGWKIDDRKVLEDLSKKTQVILSSNFSLGVLALHEILKQASPLLEKLHYLPVIVETHHRHKKDSPSGTAISLQRTIAPAGPGNVQTHSIRAGEVIGDHEVNFYGASDRITIAHSAQDRAIFGRGAIDAALWLVERRKGSHSVHGMLSMEQYFREKILCLS